MTISQLDFILEDYRNVTEGRLNLLTPLKDNMIVITGGTGFIGTWLAGLIAYLNDNYHFNSQIILLARNINHFQMARPHLAKRKDLTLIAADVRYLIELPSETNWVIHAAGTPDNRFHATYPLETMSIIANGMYSILRTLERCSNFKMLLNLSSGLIYGSQINETIINEKFTGAPACGTASSAYAEAKRYAETLCHASRSQARIPVVTARPFAFMGPYQSLEAPWALNNFIRDALSGHEIRVLSDGQSVRSYMYASDLAFWLLAILANGESGEVFNVGSPEPVTLAKLATVVAAQFETDVAIKLSAASGGQLQNSYFVPDVTKANQRFQLKLTVDLATAIKRTVIWNRQIQKNYLREIG